MQKKINIKRLHYCNVIVEFNVVFIMFHFTQKKSVKAQTFTSLPHLGNVPNVNYSSENQSSYTSAILKIKEKK